ncbi:hypothetical protein SAMN05216419_101840 [Nitrosomonas cryotolerans]|uniref:CDP-Glycerol:Poly(Glycerophosphate) glycerophosphotransferase n=1 Tax=Nitrosomonas cryotolerans ATCC 49181 TaxID=1131553 RepID=A0A1N6FST1_9PROT|nr:hypothetical protein [Nitrosomonas cryotolerans]SFP77008.1 hypothetical protein SAMN05216419_101840 [Nitrosomonas cryotolerans]SIN98386.1 hypothetical protein SAMN02743940_0390 [Nitrosomonas cryotolerans ATCC 49181]
MKALFFLRHYNDIDHITPIIFKWIDSGHQCDVVLIGSVKFRNDFRIEFLSKLNGVRVAHVRELFSPLEYIKWRLQMLLLTGNLRRLFIGPFVRVLADVYHARRRDPLWRRTANRLLTRSFEKNDGGVIAFDWIERNSVICVEWVEVVVMMAHNMGLSAVSLPHGDSPHANQLIRRGERRLEPDTLFSTARIFDKLVVPNELCAKRFRPFLDESALAVLGSPRYCEEWLIQLAELLPPSPLTRSDSQLKIVLFLRKANFTTFWEEVSEIVHMIAAFPGIELVIKPHTRSGWKQSLTKDSSIRRLSNVTIAGEDMHSVHLMNWADVTIDLATSVVFEAVRAGKPVLAADYLHAGRSAIAVYMPETELRCRDDVYEKIDYFLSHGCDSFYIEAHRQRFLREMLDVPDQNVLPRYVALLESAARI